MSEGLYYNQWTVHSRGGGKSAVGASAYGSRTSASSSSIAASAYSARCKTWDARYVSEEQDYTSKAEDHRWHEVMLPDGAPEALRDHKRLWSALEEREDRSTRPQTAQLFRSTIIAIPRGLTLDGEVALVRGYCEQFRKRGMAVQFDIHHSAASDGGLNPHAHIMLTMRELRPDGFGLKRRDWNGVAFSGGSGRSRWAKASADGLLMQMRKEWAEHCNRALEAAGRPERVDWRSLKDQGIDREPQVKKGKVHHMRRTHGKAAERLLNYHSVNQRNRMREQIIEVEPVGIGHMIGNSNTGVEEPPRRKRLPDLGHGMDV